MSEREVMRWKELGRGSRALAELVAADGYQPDMGAPWGGVKNSGTGREQGPQSVDSFTRIDTVYTF